MINTIYIKNIHRLKHNIKNQSPVLMLKPVTGFNVVREWCVYILKFLNSKLMGIFASGTFSMCSIGATNSNMTVTPILFLETYSTCQLLQLSQLSDANLSITDGESTICLSREYLIGNKSCL